jgi:hypothetical protein
MPLKSPKQKGARLEHAVVKIFQSFGIKAEKVPLSGVLWKTHPGDVNVHFDTGPHQVLECKSRKQFSTLYGWLENRSLLVLKGDRKPALMVLPLEDFLKLLHRAENNELILNFVPSIEIESEPNNDTI